MVLLLLLCKKSLMCYISTAIIWSCDLVKKGHHVSGLLCFSLRLKEATFLYGFIFTGHDCSWIWLIQEALELIFAAFTTFTPLERARNSWRTYTSEALIWTRWFLKKNVILESAQALSSQWSCNDIHKLDNPFSHVLSLKMWLHTDIVVLRWRFSAEPFTSG